MRSKKQGLTGALLLLLGTTASAAEHRGVFFDYPVQGLGYAASPSGLSGSTASDGSFRYRDGDQLTFRLGPLILGSTPAKEWIIPQDLVLQAHGDVSYPRLTNIAMLIQSLDQNGNIEDGIVIPQLAHEVVSSHAQQLWLGQPSETFFRVLSEAIIPDIAQRGGFERVSGGVMKNTDETGAHYARTPEMARNQLRRTAAGIMRTTDVKIPLRHFDATANPSAYVLGTLHRPVGPKAPAKVPVVLNMGVYGKDKIFGSVCTREQLQQQEIVEDRYGSGNPDKLPYENHESVDTFVWVPKGYAVLRVDEAGIGRSPGVLSPWSQQGSLNYIDTIEWAGTQPWSNGNVGTNGISYYAISQWLMAAQLPQNTHLKAMIPWEGGADVYRDDWYAGGLYLPKYVEMWSTYRVAHNTCGKPQPMDFLRKWNDTPTREPAVWDEYTADVSKLRVPFLSAAGVDNVLLHPRGNVTAFRLAPIKDKLLRINDGSHIEPFYSEEGVADQMAFFDYWLKGIDTGIMKKPRVKISMKTGNGGAYWAYAQDWPLPKTQYTKFYLDARKDTSGFNVDGTMPTYELHPSHDVVTASQNPITAAPRRKAEATYSAAVKPIVVTQQPNSWPKVTRYQPCDSFGISFATPPLQQTIRLAGHAKLVAWVSSSTEDLDLNVSLRVYDETGQQVVYPTDTRRVDATEKAPIQVGRLKVSHRKLDTEKSTFFQPVHTHLASDVQALRPGQIVPVEVEFWPLTAEIQKGHRIVIDVQPYHGCGHTSIHEYGSYNTGTNTLHTGPQHISYLQLPIVSGLTDATADVQWSVPGSEQLARYGTSRWE